MKPWLLLLLPLLLLPLLLQDPDKRPVVTPAPAGPADGPTGSPAAGAQGPTADQLLAQAAEQLKKEGITVDAKAGTVSIPAVVNEARQEIEYLLIHRRGKTHEAVFVTKSKPSVINAALLMLGLEPGKNADYVEKQPPPSLEEIENGVDPIIVTPPSGTGLWMTVRWAGAEGKPVEHCVEDVLFDLTTQEPLGECRWVYLGGRMARLYKDDPEVYVADFEGNLVSVCYMRPTNHLATLVHEHARDEQNWWTTKLLPDRDTEVEFVFHKNEPAIHAERRKRLAAAKDKSAPAAADQKGAPPPAGSGK